MPSRQFKRKSSKAPRLTGDSSVDRVLRDVYDEINNLVDSVNTPYVSGEISSRDGKPGDIRVVKDLSYGLGRKAAESAYFLEAKTEDGWVRQYMDRTEHSGISRDGTIPVDLFKEDTKKQIKQGDLSFWKADAGFTKLGLTSTNIYTNETVELNKGMYLKESNTYRSNKSGWGQLWVNTSNNDLYFNDGAGSGSVRITDGGSLAGGGGGGTVDFDSVKTALAAADEAVGFNNQSIGSATWNGSVISEAKGGTGVTSTTTVGKALLGIADAVDVRYIEIAADESINVYNKSDFKTQLAIHDPITVQANGPTAITDFAQKPFIYSTNNNKLYHKIDGTDYRAYSGITYSFSFSISDARFTTDSGGSSEASNAILVGANGDENYYLDMVYANVDGTLTSNPTITYRRYDLGTDTLSTVDTSNDGSHLNQTVADGMNQVSQAAFTVIDTDNASDTSGESSFNRHYKANTALEAHVSVTETGITDTETSERYWFVNGMVWGECAATTGPDQSEFTEAFQDLNGTGHGYALPNIGGSGSANDFLLSHYHSDFGERTITAAAGQYIFFGWPKLGGTAVTIKDTGGTDISGDFRAVQEVTLANSKGYTEIYNIYVSENTGVSSAVVVT